MDMQPAQRRHTLRRRVVRGLVLLLLGYGTVAYLLLPEIWTFRDRSAVSRPGRMVTHTPDNIPGDPINLGLVGGKADIVRAFAAAGWDAADAITLKSSIEIAESVVFSRPYPDAPVSTLLFEGRRQDLAFEKPVGDSADRRQHVRLWRTPRKGANDGELWLGSATFDKGVGLSHDTGQVTHHIDANVDSERDALIADLTRAGWIASTYTIEGIGPTDTARNGGGDPYFTDGKALVGVLAMPKP